MAAIIGISNRHGLIIEGCLRNQTNKSKLVLYIIHYFHFKSRLKQLYIYNQTEHFSCIGENVMTHIEGVKRRAE